MISRYQKNLVSVIIPVHNREDLVIYSLDSVLQQTYRPIEVIVVDDGSSDNTYFTVKSWIDLHAESDFMCFLFKQLNRGAPAARNYGMNMSSGEYIQFLDSDDAISKDKLKDGIYELKKDESADFVYSLRADFDMDRQKAVPCKDVYAPLETGPNASQVALNYVWTAMPIFRRNLLYLVGDWNEELTCLQDWEYIGRVASIANKAIKIDKYHAFYRQSADNRISKQKWGTLNAVRSNAIASTTMYSLIIREPESETKKEALESLLDRLISCVRVSAACGDGTFSRSVLYSACMHQEKRGNVKLEVAFWRIILKLPDPMLKLIFKPVRLIRG
ncbi:glycosyl transferase family 2 [Marinobacter sp. LV10R520-4]|uniref:glycosyltransferase family A protein n=1 Tax=Marinobacter sp. LV10R520-4 TaxID=1761796 RepID=UPI000BF28666|nr:glycosyltransferase family A protein [Marinobacter sp. LV10R520-4]PFG51196.1 glycosyl transferase family 2 [Marinobacter sp. LV10R520-4]